MRVELAVLGRHTASSCRHEILKRVAVRRRTYAGDGRINRDAGTVAEGERQLTDVVADTRCQRGGGFLIRVVQKGDEFVAAVAEEDIRHPQARPRLPYHVAKDIIANGPSMQKVDLLEPNNVNEHE